MPKYRVTAPDGTTYEVNAPEGATQADAIEYVKNNMAPAPSAASAKGGRPTPSAGGVKDSWLGGIVRGLRDPIDAGAQILTHVLPQGVIDAGDAVGNKLAEYLPFVAPSDNSAKGVKDLVVPRAHPSVAEINTNAEQDYAQNWRQGKDVGLDGGRIVGNIAGTLPFAPYTGGATMGARALAGARAGAITGGLNPVQNDENFWMGKAAQVGLGGVAGGVATPLVEAGLRGGVSAAEKLIDKGRATMARFAGNANDDAATRIVMESLSAKGIDPSQVGKDVLEGLVADVRKATAKYGGVDKERVARAENFRTLGIDPLKSWVTRDPVAFSRTKNLGGIEGAGEPIQRAEQALNERLISGVNAGQPGSQFDLGVVAERALKSVNAKDDATINSLYAAFREIAPKAEGNGARFVNDVSTLWDEHMVGGAAPGDIITRLGKISDGKFPITFSTLAQMRAAANSHLAGAKGAERKALGIFKDSIDREMQTMASEASTAPGALVNYSPAFAKLQESLPKGATAQEALDTLKSATSTFRDVAQKREAAPALQAVVEGKLDPESFFRQYVQGGSVREVRAMMAAVPSGEFRAVLRAQMLNEAKKAAIGSASDETGTFSAAGFSKWMQAPGMKEKLATVLGPKEVAQLERIQRAAEDALKLPAGHRVNTSNSSQGVANLAGRALQKMGQIPVLGPGAAFLIQPAQKAIQGAEAAGLARTGAADLGVATNLFDERRRRAIYSLSGLLAGPAGAAAAYEPMR